MKPILTALFVLVLGIGTIGAAELKLEWQNAEDYRDADYYYNGSDKSREIVLKNLERYFTKEAKKRLEKGSVLELTVTELDLAGDFEPWRSPSWHDVRIVKEIYPALIEFDFRYLDDSGNVIAEGSEKLRDRMVPSSMAANFMGRSENYPYVKTLVKDWMRRLDRD